MEWGSLNWEKMNSEGWAMVLAAFVGIGRDDEGATEGDWVEMVDSGLGDGDGFGGRGEGGGKRERERV